jgi:hypothetical protein
MRFLTKLQHGFTSANTSDTSKVNIYTYNHRYFKLGKLTCPTNNPCASGPWQSNEANAWESNDGDDEQSDFEPIRVYSLWKDPGKKGSSTFVDKLPSGADGWYVCMGSVPSSICGLRRPPDVPDACKVDTKNPRKVISRTLRLRWHNKDYFCSLAYWTGFGRGIFVDYAKVDPSYELAPASIIQGSECPTGRKDGTETICGDNIFRYTGADERVWDQEEQVQDWKSGQWVTRPAWEQRGGVLEVLADNVAYAGLMRDRRYSDYSGVSVGAPTKDLYGWHAAPGHVIEKGAVYTYVSEREAEYGVAPGLKVVLPAGWKPYQWVRYLQRPATCVVPSACPLGPYVDR